MSRRKAITTPIEFDAIECDWGDCEQPASGFRWDDEEGWLGVCAEHAFRSLAPRDPEAARMSTPLAERPCRVCGGARVLEMAVVGARDLPDGALLIERCYWCRGGGVEWGARGPEGKA